MRLSYRSKKLLFHILIEPPPDPYDPDTNKSEGTDSNAFAIVSLPNTILVQPFFYTKRL